MCQKILHLVIDKLKPAFHFKNLIQKLIINLNDIECLNF